jgi:hypothetical protein
MPITSPFREVCSSATRVSATVPPLSCGSKVMGWPDAADSSAERSVTVPAGGVVASSRLLTTMGFEPAGGAESSPLLPPSLQANSAARHGSSQRP